MLCRTIGMFRMRDEAGGDDKLLCVPATDVRWEPIQDLKDISAHERAEIRHFFDVYKALEPNKSSEVRGWQPHWLVMFGQTALMLYFVHQIIAYMLVHQWLHVNFKSWAMFWLSNLALVVLCIGLGYAWLAIKARARGWRFRPGPAATS